MAGSARLAERLDGVTPANVVQRCEAEPSSTPSLTWGRARFFEQTLVPRTLEQSLSEIDARSPMRCAQCGDQSLATSCAFCSAREGLYA